MLDHVALLAFVVLRPLVMGVWPGMMATQSMLEMMEGELAAGNLILRRARRQGRAYLYVKKIKAWNLWLLAVQPGGHRGNLTRLSGWLIFVVVEDVDLAG